MFIRLFFVIVFLDVLLCFAIYIYDLKTHISSPNNSNSLSLPQFVQMVLDLLILLCFIGYIVLAGLNYYWFRYKYCNDKRIASKTMKFLWIFIMQCAFVSADWVLSYQCIYSYDDPVN